MHTHKTDNTVFHYNSDFSGGVTVLQKDDTGRVVANIEIPAADLLEFVAYCYVQPNRLREVEGMTVEALLGSQDQ